MVKPSRFFLHVIIKHLYTQSLPLLSFNGVLANLPINELAVVTKTRADMSINLLCVWFIGTRALPMYQPENRCKVHINHEWHLELVLSIMKLNE